MRALRERNDAFSLATDFGAESRTHTRGRVCTPRVYTYTLGHARLRYPCLAHLRRLLPHRSARALRERNDAFSLATDFGAESRTHTRVYAPRVCTPRVYTSRACPTPISLPRPLEKTSPASVCVRALRERNDAFSLATDFGAESRTHTRVAYARLAYTRLGHARLRYPCLARLRRLLPHGLRAGSARAKRRVLSRNRFRC